MTKQILTKSSRYKNGTWRRVNIFWCDRCGDVFQRTYRKCDCESASLTFCTDTCRNDAQAGQLTKKRAVNSHKKYGCHYTQLDEVKQKMLDTRVEKYGTKAPVHYHEATRQKYQDTMFERHGVVDPLPDARLAFRKKHGVMSPWALPEVRVRNDFSVNGQKGYQVMSRRSKKLLSTPERQLGEWLCQRYGSENVNSTYPIVYRIDDGKEYKWLIDYYVSSIDTYFQLDGVFWHGLDKSSEERARFPRIQRHYDIDREQNVWFLKEGLRLVRITDLEWKKCHQTGNYDDILRKLGG